MAIKTMTLVERFWSKVEQVPENSCFEWTGGKFQSGYGQFWTPSKNWKAHRFSYELQKGPISRNLSVLHLCNNKGCVRIDHLRLGTHKENMEYMVKCNRQCRGQNVNSSKLTEIQVIQIRERLNKEGPYVLAREFGINPSNIYNIKHKKYWKHL